MSTRRRESARSAPSTSRADLAARRMCATFASIELAEASSGDSCPFAVRFNAAADARGTFVAIGDQNGTVTVSDATRASSMSPRWTATAHENAVFDVAWTCDDARVLTASADTTAAMFDVETKVLSARFEGHDASVKALAMRPTNRDVFATGGRDGRLLVFDARCSTRVVRENEDAPYLSPKKAVRYAHKAHTPGVGRRSRLHSVTSAAFDNGGDVLLGSGGSDGPPGDDGGGRSRRDGCDHFANAFGDEDRGRRLVL